MKGGLAKNPLIDNKSFINTAESEIDNIESEIDKVIPLKKSTSENKSIESQNSLAKKNTTKIQVTSEMLLNTYPNNLFYSKDDKYYKTPILTTPSYMKRGDISNDNFEAIFSEIKNSKLEDVNMSNITFQQCLEEYHSIINNPEKHGDIHFIINLFLLLQNNPEECFNISNTYVNVKENNKSMKGGMDQGDNNDRPPPIQRVPNPNPEERKEQRVPIEQNIRILDDQMDIIELGPENKQLVYLIPPVGIFTGLLALSVFLGMSLTNPIFLSGLIAASIIIMGTGTRRILNLIGNGANDNLIPYISGNRYIDTGIPGLKRLINFTLIEPNIERLAKKMVLPLLPMFINDIKLQRVILDRDQFNDANQRRLQEYGKVVFVLQPQASLQEKLKNEQERLGLLIDHYAKKQPVDEMMPLPPIPNQVSLWNKFNPQWQQYLSNFIIPPPPLGEDQGTAEEKEVREKNINEIKEKNNGNKQPVINILPFPPNAFQRIVKENLVNITDAYKKILINLLGNNSIAQIWAMTKVTNNLKPLFIDAPLQPTHKVPKYLSLECPRCMLSFKFNEELGYICRENNDYDTEQQKSLNKLVTFPSNPYMECLKDEDKEKTGYQFNENFELTEEQINENKKQEPGQKPEHKKTGEFLTCSECVWNCWHQEGDNSLWFGVPFKFPRGSDDYKDAEIEVKDEKMMLDIWNSIFSKEVGEVIERNNKTDPPGGETVSVIRTACEYSFKKYTTHMERQIILELERDNIMNILRHGGNNDPNETDIMRGLELLSEVEKKKYREDNNIKYIEINCPVCTQADKKILSGTFHAIRKANRIDNLFCHCEACGSTFNGYSNETIAPLLYEYTATKLDKAIADNIKNIYPAFLLAEQSRKNLKIFSIGRERYRQIKSAKIYLDMEKAEKEMRLAKGDAKQCPVCKELQVISGGCASVSCATPGCGTEMCYVCGEEIKNPPGSAHDTEHFLMESHYQALPMTAPFGGYFTLQCCNVNWTIKGIDGTWGPNHGHKQQLKDSGGEKVVVPSTYDIFHEAKTKFERSPKGPAEQAEFNKITGYWLKTQNYYRKFQELRKVHSLSSLASAANEERIPDNYIWTMMDRLYFYGNTFYPNDPLMTGFRDKSLDEQKTLIETMLVGNPNNTILEIRRKLIEISQEIEHKQGVNNNVIVDISQEDEADRLKIEEQGRKVVEDQLRNVPNVPPIVQDNLQNHLRDNGNNNPIPIPVNDNISDEEMAAILEIPLEDFLVARALDMVHNEGNNNQQPENRENPILQENLEQDNIVNNEQDDIVNNDGLDEEELDVEILQQLFDFQQQEAAEREAAEREAAERAAAEREAAEREAAERPVERYGRAAERMQREAMQRNEQIEINQTRADFYILFGSLNDNESINDNEGEDIPPFYYNRAIRQINQILRANAWLRDELIQSGWFEAHQNMVKNEQNIVNYNPLGGFVMMDSFEKQRQLAVAENNLLQQEAERHEVERHKQEEQTTKWNELIDKLQRTLEKDETDETGAEYKRPLLTMIENITLIRDRGDRYPLQMSDEEQNDNILIRLNILRFFYKFGFYDFPSKVNRIYFCKYRECFNQQNRNYNYLLFRQENGSFGRYSSHLGGDKIDDLGIGDNNTEFPQIYFMNINPGHYVELECNIAENSNGMDILYLLMENFNKESNIKYLDIEHLLKDINVDLGSNVNGDTMYRIFWNMKNPDLGGGGRGKKITLTKKRKNRVYVVGEKNMKGTRKNRKNKKRTKK